MPCISFDLTYTKIFSFDIHKSFSSDIHKTFSLDIHTSFDFDIHKSFSFDIHNSFSFDIPKTKFKRDLHKNLLSHAQFYILTSTNILNSIHKK